MPAAGFDASQDAAVKVMRDEAVRAPGFWRRFRGERDALLALRHRHVALVLDMGEDGGVPYMAFEWVGGGDLRRQLAQGRLATGRALRWLLEIASAVEHAHGKGLLHGDIKPANVLLRDDGAACLADFGLATLVIQQDAGGGQPTRGTLGYMAPEQLDGAAASPASDQYALGVMGYEMLAGKAPFGSGEVIAVLHRQLAGELQPLRALDPSLPEGLCGVVERMMARRAEDRFASVAEALRALEACSALHREDEARG